MELKLENYDKTSVTVSMSMTWLSEKVKMLPWVIYYSWFEIFNDGRSFIYKPLRCFSIFYIREISMSVSYTHLTLPTKRIV